MVSQITLDYRLHSSFVYRRGIRRVELIVLRVFVISQYIDDLFLLAAVQTNSDMLDANRDDLISTLRVKEFLITDGKDLSEVPSRIGPVHSKLGPEYKAKAKEIVGKLAKMDPSVCAEQLDGGAVVIELDVGSKAELDCSFVEVETHHRSHGRDVDTIKAGGVTVIIGK